MNQSQKKVMVFGAFDGLHEGHRAFLTEARRLGNELIVVVAQDATIEELKKKHPKESLGQRIASIRDANLADTILAGDLMLGSWSAIRRYEPDIVALGYDQKDLKDKLTLYQSDTKLPFELIVLTSYKGDKYHTSILNKGQKEENFSSKLERRIAEKRRKWKRGEYLADFVYGANDGIITTFAVVTGAVGAALSPGVIVILGIANLLADGFSMGASRVLSTLSDRNFHKSLRKEQEYDIEHNPEVAEEEVRHVLRGWDTPKAALEPMMLSITRSKRRWSDFVLREEYNITDEDTERPFRHGFATFIAFVIVGTLPLIPYIFKVPTEKQFVVSIISTGLALFITGASQSLLTQKRWWLRTGIQMLVIGGIATTISYWIGFAVKTVFNIVV